MSTAAETLDVGVVIERVLVRVQPCEAAAPPDPGQPPRRAASGDHRVVIGELRVDTDGALEGYEARRLGARVAEAVAEGLAALQERRLQAIRAGRSRGGRVRIDALGLVLRGAQAERPDVRGAAIALVDAVERRLGS